MSSVGILADVLLLMRKGRIEGQTELFEGEVVGANLLFSEWGRPLFKALEHC